MLPQRVVLLSYIFPFDFSSTFQNRHGPLDAQNAGKCITIRIPIHDIILNITRNKNVPFMHGGWNHSKIQWTIYVQYLYCMIYRIRGTPPHNNNNVTRIEFEKITRGTKHDFSYYTFYLLYVFLLYHFFSGKTERVSILSHSRSEMYLFF